MIYVPIESIMTKWYGESERNLAAIFDASQKIDNSILFLDEIDSLAGSREKNMYEATRRVLSVLLRKIDGFDIKRSSLIIGATNRKQDLDPALLSRFDASIYFPLPNKHERKDIFSNYAIHLDDVALDALADGSEGVSGRNIKDICEQSERSWASKMIRHEEHEELPRLEDYLIALEKRKEKKI